MQGRFRTTRKKAGRGAEPSAASGSTAAKPISVQWLLDRLGFDEATFWREEDPCRFIDPLVAVETVALAHADAGFPAFLPAWDESFDAKHEGKSFKGRLIAAAMNGGAIDWPLGRSWFHELFMDLARLDGALGIDLSSEERLKHAVSCYWKRMGVHAKAHAASLQPQTHEPQSPIDDGCSASISPTQPMKQLALF